MKKVGRNVYGSGDTIVTKTSHFFQGLTLGAEGGGGGEGACTRYFTVHVYRIKRYSNNGRIVDAGDEYLSTSEWRNINRLFRIDKIH